RVGDPLDAKTLIGPLIDNDALKAMQKALAAAQKQGGKILTGGVPVKGKGAYVTPAIVEMKRQADIVRHETFAPILYVLGYKKFEDAITLQNDVPQGLASCIFTND